MSVITIKNDNLKVSINTYGAELFSVVNSSDREFIWQGGPEWADHSPVLFPIVSKLKDDTYTLNGKEYHMPIHGFASKSEFEVEAHSEDSVTFLLKSNETTLLQYPFEFEFRVRFSLDGLSLREEYITKNTSPRDMYYSTGSHEGYACPGGIDNYTIIFDENETTTRYAQLYDETGSGYKDFIPFLNNEREVKLDYHHFADDGITLTEFKSEGVTLRDDRTGDKIHISFPGFDTLLFWTKKGARGEYICIEPWCGTWDFENLTPCDFSEKYRIRTLRPGEVETLCHTITFHM